MCTEMQAVWCGVCVALYRAAHDCSEDDIKAASVCLCLLELAATVHFPTIMLILTLILLP